MSKELGYKHCQRVVKTSAYEPVSDINLLKNKDEIIFSELREPGFHKGKIAGIFARQPKHAPGRLEKDFQVLTDKHGLIVISYDINGKLVPESRYKIEGVLIEAKIVKEPTIRKVVFLKNRKRTTILLNGKAYSVTYKGDIEDKGNKKILGFLYAIYKIINYELTNDQINRKIDLILGGKSPSFVEAYLTGAFIESNLIQVHKAYKLIETIKRLDDSEDRIEIKF